MSGPRNLKAFEAGQRARAAIRQTWLDLIAREPFKRHTAMHVWRALPPEFCRLSLRTVQWHMAQIEVEGAPSRVELGCVPRNSSTVEPPLR